MPEKIKATAIALSPSEELRENILELVENLADFVEGRVPPSVFTARLVAIRTHLMEASDRYPDA